MIGIIAALGSAYSGTLASYLFREQTRYFTAIQINLIKSIIGFLIFIPALFTIDIISNYKNIIILIISGMIGISIGDFFYINALKRIGTRKTLTIEALSPLLVNILGSLIINESISIKAWIGTVIVTCSLIGISIEKIDNNEYNQIINYRNGFAYGTLSVLCTVIAAILSRSVLANSNFNPLQASELRFFGALVILIPYLKSNLRKKYKAVPNQIKIKLIYASILSTNIELLLQQTVFKLLPVGLGWTLLSCAALISLFYAKSEGENINIYSIILTLSTIFGVFIAYNG